MELTENPYHMFKTAANMNSYEPILRVHILLKLSLQSRKFLCPLKYVTDACFTTLYR